MNDYHEDTTHLTKTALSLFCDSPREYYLQFVTLEMERKQTTKAMATGTALHAMLLENKKLEDVIGIYPASCLRSDGGLNWKPAAQFRADNPDKVAFCKTEDAEDIQIVYDNVKDSVISDAIRESEHFEKEFRANVYGMNCKCRPDIAGELDEHWMVYDLKFMDRVNPVAFQRSARSFKYWLQDAHYSAVLRQLTGKPVAFKFLAVEIQFPFRVQAYWYGARQREIARDYHKKKVEEVVECHRNGNWKDDWNGELELNPWDVGNDTSEILDWEEAA